jgi:phosphoribosylanthranilate isomerase
VITKVKICGVTRPEDAAAACELGAWAVGMIFVPGTPRCLSVERARAIASEVTAGALKVGVFLDATREEILRIDREVGLDLVQLHGTETAALVKSVGRDRCVKTVYPGGEGALSAAADSPAEFLLVDRPRGNSAPSDAAFASRLVERREKVLFAGGLTPGNVADAVRAVRPWGVDVSSGVERAPGVKDGEKLAAFFEAAASAEERR